MGDNSKIEWCDATWNVVTGCSVLSPGCAHCYAMRLAGTRLKHEPSRAGLTEPSRGGPVWTGEVRFNEQWLDQPLRWRRRRRIFVCANGDLFHEAVPDAWIDRVFAVMALAPQHTFLVLTKRAERMRAYLSSGRAHPVGLAALEQTMLSMSKFGPRSRVGEGCILQGDIAHLKIWPLPHVWLGVSVEDQPRADERIPHLLATPAAVRFISAEPLLSGIDLTRLPIQRAYGSALLNSLTGRSETHKGDPLQHAAHVDWVITGGESGPGARPMHADWARSLRDQCVAVGVPFFFKQWGEWVPPPDADDDTYEEHRARGARDFHFWPDGGCVELVGKRSAGRLLDGRKWNEMPRP